jgi:DNA-binding MarR family transcriptional regulator
MFSRMTSPAFLLAQASRLYAASLQEALAPLGIAPAQFLVLTDLVDGSDRTQGDLAARLDVEQPTMANTLARMERDGLIIRRSKPGDKRVQIIGLTAKARELYERAEKAAVVVNGKGVQGLTTEERLRFLGTLARIIENLKAEPQ